MSCGRRDRWFEEKGKADYISTKQAICAYVARQAFGLLLNRSQP